MKTDALPRVGELWLMTSSDDGHVYEALCIAADHGVGISVLEHDACVIKVTAGHSGVLLEERSALPPRPAARVVIWPWQHAPMEYRALSPHGGDEDWVAWVAGRGPGAQADGYGVLPTWLTWSFATSHRIPGGTIYIGAHA